MYGSASAFWVAYMGIEGGSGAAVVVPDVPGMEWRVPAARMHYKATQSPLRYKTPETALHYRAEET